MKKSNLLLFIALCWTICSNAGVVKQFDFQQCKIELLDSASAAEATNHSDEYTKALTTFDLQIRLGRKENVTEHDYLERAASQALTWNEKDVEKLRMAFMEIERFLNDNGIQLNLPKNIQLLKTAGAEEFEAEGYTRQNRIMLCVKGGQDITTHLVAHELFHVYSRFNPVVRNNVYAIFGFEKCNRINTAEAMDNRMITNPDCPFIEHFTTMYLARKNRNFVLQLYSKAPFEEQFDLRNANIALLELEDKNGKKAPLLKDGKGHILPIDEFPQLFTKISPNTPYVLHPEEIAAEHFAMLITGKREEEIPKPELVDKIKKVLSEAK